MSISGMVGTLHWKESGINKSKPDYTPLSRAPWHNLTRSEVDLDENTDWNWRFKALALSTLDVTVDWPSLRGPMARESCLEFFSKLKRRFREKSDLPTSSGLSDGLFNPKISSKWLIVYFYISCVRTAKALARLRGCASSPEPSLVVYHNIMSLLK